MRIKLADLTALTTSVKRIRELVPLTGLVTAARPALAEMHTDDLYDLLRAIETAAAAVRLIEAKTTLEIVD